MNGYRALVERHRRWLAEAASLGERTAVSSFDWLVAAVDGVADAAHAPKPHVRGKGEPQSQRERGQQ